MDTLKKKLTGHNKRQYELSLEDIAALIKAGSVRNVVVCAGAGISTSAGIPDFRSPETGLYHNLKKLNLDYPEQVFDIDFFRRKPEPFFQLAHELYPGKFQPTMAHAFIRLLHEKDILLRCFTQNIDTLERRAGIPPERIVEAHGSFAGNHCIASRCGREADAEKTKEIILQKKIPRCQKCNSLVKPDIVFFGEGLPNNFFKKLGDLKKADLVIVMGTSLQVQPFASLPDRVSADCPRLLLNLEEVGDFHRELDVVQLSKCDDAVVQLAQACGWEQDLCDLHERIRKANTDKSIKPVDKPARPEAAPGSAENTEDTTAKENVDNLVERLKGTNL